MFIIQIEGGKRFLAAVFPKDELTKDRTKAALLTEEAATRAKGRLQRAGLKRVITLPVNR